MTACRPALKLQEPGPWPAEWGWGKGLQRQAIFMQHITGTGWENPGRRDLKKRATNVPFRGKSLLSAPCHR